ncbi:MAG: hypothetical protein HDT28_07065 [Clostridiales bacterium]|nr:hypothetical protein [Clostridiales bacterium]
METLKNTKSKLAAVNKDILGFINAFVDEQSFVETDAFMCSQNILGVEAGDGVVSGFASVGDTGVCLFALNSKVLKGSIGEQNAKKIVRTINNAVRMDKPLIAVWDTSGARFTEGIGALEGYGAILRAYTVACGEVPIISVIKGNNLGLSAYITDLSDFVIAYPDSVLASSSPLVLAGASGADAKKIGSVKQIAEKGLITNVVKNDKELRENIVKILSVFNDGAKSGDDPNRVCKGLKAGVTPAALIKEVFDKNSFYELRKDFAPVAITGFATLGDVRVGVVATDITKADGRLTADACAKIGAFLMVCENAECPVIFLTDCLGTDRSGDDCTLIREMSNLIYQVNSLDVDAFALVYGKAIGGAYTSLVAPCDYKIAWDCAEIGALESEAAARLIYADDIKSSKNKEKAAEKLAASYSEENNSALVLAKNGYFDNVIEPNLTRQYLLAALLAHVE